MGLVGDGISAAIKDRVKSKGFNNQDYSSDVIIEDEASVDI
jgi:hypothetical protein